MSVRSYLRLVSRYWLGALLALDSVSRTCPEPARGCKRADSGGLRFAAHFNSRFCPSRPDFGQVLAEQGAAAIDKTSAERDRGLGQP